MGAPETPVAATPAAKPTTKGAVIRRVRDAGETPHQRLVRRQIPAWVISGAVHVALIGVLIGVDSAMGKPAAPLSDKEIAIVADDKPAEQADPNLTNPDIGLDPDLMAAVEAPKLDEVNVESQVVSQEPPGTETAQSDLKQDIIPPPGVGAPNLDAGVAGDTGNFMQGAGGGSGMANSGFVGRGGATRSKLLAAGGGNSRSEAAVARGMAWLAKQQKANGSWAYDGTSRSDTAAATGMALLPFLAAGQTHKASKDNKYKRTVEAALRYLISIQKPTGQFNGAGMYSQAIATCALCEALGMTGDRSLLQYPAQRAVNYIQRAQAVNGSWGYTPNKTGDTSIVGWQIQALHSAKLCKELVVDKRVLQKAMKFLDSVASGSSQSRYGYRDAKSPSPTRTAVGLLCRYYENGWGPNNPGMADGVKYLMKSHMPTTKNIDMYYYYYATQVLHFFEGPEWHKEWNPKMRDMLVDLQVPQGKRDFGSWDPQGDSWIGGHCGRVGMTATCLLTLEVYYRHLPLYKRGTGGLKELERAK
jgi:hypothetical protein